MVPMVIFRYIHPTTGGGGKLVIAEATGRNSRVGTIISLSMIGIAELSGLQTSIIEIVLTIIFTCRMMEISCNTVVVGVRFGLHRRMTGAGGRDGVVKASTLECFVFGIQTRTSGG